MNRFFVVLTVCLLFSSFQLPAQTKRALVIGLGEQEDKSWAKINGDKDVPYVKEMLVRMGYTDVTTLVNKQATKAGIVSAFETLAAKCAEGDVVYIHFSGHGQQVTDVNGDERPDTFDEAWIPYDAYMKYDAQRYTGEKHLVDDEINVLLKNVKSKIGSKGGMLVVVDACHSGGSTREPDASETIRGASDQFIIPGDHHGNAAKQTEQWLTLTACKNYQRNEEMKDPQIGKLTYALYLLAKEGKVTMNEIENFMHKHRSSWPQNPELSGDTSTYDLSDFFR